MQSAYKTLKKKAELDPLWTAVNFGCGNRDTTATINGSANSASSSLLEMIEAAKELIPEATYVSKEQVKICPLDSVFEKYCTPADNIFLKIDTQWFEKSVLSGADNSLRHIDCVPIELSLILLYEDGAPFTNIYND